MPGRLPRVGTLFDEGKGAFPQGMADLCDQDGPPPPGPLLSRGAPLADEPPFSWPRLGEVDLRLFP